AGSSEQEYTEQNPVHEPTPERVMSHAGSSERRLKSCGPPQFPKECGRMRASRTTLRIEVRPPVRGRLSPAALTRIRTRARRMVLAAALAEGDSFEVGLVLTDDAEIRALNRDYRAKNKPTDVLAFAMREGAGVGHARGLLGDVVISLDTAARQ